MVKIILTLNKETELSQLNQCLKDTFCSIKEELEDHLTAINENTNETQSNYELVAELSAKLERIEERIEAMELLLSFPKLPKKVEKLSKKEEKVFLTLYKEEQNYLTYAEIASSLSLSESAIRYYIEMLINKGIPIIKKTVNNKVYLKLNPHFRREQAKKNILNLHPDLTLDMFDQRISD